MNDNISYGIQIDERAGRGKTITSKQIYDFSLMAFLCFPALNYVFSAVLGALGLESLSRIITLMVIYVPVIIISINKKRIVNDFWIIWFGVVLFFLFTYLIHPEYEPWYTREEYGVWDYVLRPENGIYIYLLLRLINDPVRILRCIKWSSWPMYAYYAIAARNALARGYWIDFSNRGYEIHLNYNLSVGYNLLLFSIAFLYCALENRKLYDWIGAAIGIGLILVAGSRGPILDVLIFLVIYMIIKIEKSRKKAIAIVGVIIAGLLLYYAYPYLMMGSAVLLNKFNITSRFVDKLVNGTIADDSGRIVIWKAALNMIKEWPFGYGAMGSRPVISKYIYVAHPHNMFLEIMIDFGVIIGAALIIWLLYWSVKLLAVKNNDAWRGLFLIFFSRACQLLISLTFWHSIGLWGALAIGVCMWRDCKRKRRLADGR